MLRQVPSQDRRLPIGARHGHNENAEEVADGQDTAAAGNK